MKYIQIRNAGNIEVEALTLLGASTKRDDDEKIGFFGSGIKYTVAYLLRHSLDFRIFSGREEIKFQTKEVNLRGKDFKQVLVNGVETSITTSWGENWEKWQIFREIVTNAFDEENFDISLTDSVSPVDGLTTFYLSYSDFSEYYDGLGDFFNVDLIKETDSRVLLKDEPSPMKVFKKGVRIIEEGSEIVSLFDYHLPNAELNEERIASEWEMRYHISSLLLRCEDEHVVGTLYKALQDDRKDLFEVQEILSNPASYTKLSDKWLKVINESETKVVPSGSEEFIEREKGKGYLEANNIKAVPARFIEKAKESFGTEYKGSFDSDSDVRDDLVVLDSLEEKDSIKKYEKLLEDHGMHLHLEIKPARFKDKDVRTHVEDDIIYISAESLRDRERAVQALVEAYIRIEYSGTPADTRMEEGYRETLASILVHKLI